MTARQRRQAVDHLKSRQVSERRACRLIGFSRSAAWRKLKGRDDHVLRSRLKVLAERYPRYGYPTLHDMLKIEGHIINPKRTYQIYREEGLQVRAKHRKKLIRPRIRLTRPLPKTIVCDNGPEFTSKAMFFWAKRTGVKLHFIQLGKPTQNAFVESFNGKFREYCLNLN